MNDKIYYVNYCREYQVMLLWDRNSPSKRKSIKLLSPDVKKFFVKKFFMHNEMLNIHIPCTKMIIADDKNSGFGISCYMFEERYEDFYYAIIEAADIIKHAKKSFIFKGIQRRELRGAVYLLGGNIHAN